MRSQTASASTGARSLAQVELSQLGVGLARQDQRQRDRAVEQVGAPGLAGALRRPGDVQHVVEQLEGHADPFAERGQGWERTATLDRPELARRAEQHRRLEAAALQVSLHVDRSPRVGPLHQLTGGELRAGPREHPHRRHRARFDQLGEGAGEQQVPGRGGESAARGSDHSRAAAAQRRSVQDIVVDQRGAVHQLHRHRGAQQALGLRRWHAGGEEYQQRAQALAAGRDRLAGVTAEQRAVPGGELGHAQLEPVHQPRGRLAAGLDHRLHGAHRGTSPTCRAMIPPAVSTYLTLRRPQLHITAASSAGGGNRRTELGR